MNKAFTLIELLVVVLIIGILSAIALPQYAKAVEKARLAEAMTNIKAIETAVKETLLSEGSFPAGMKFKDVMSTVELTGGSWNDAGTTYTTRNFKYNGSVSSSIGGSDADELFVEIHRDTGDNDLYRLDIGFYHNRTSKGCYNDGDTAVGTTVCANLAGQGWS